MPNTPTAPSTLSGSTFQPSPITNANQGTHHQHVGTPSAATQAPAYYNPQPYGNALASGILGIGYSETLHATGGTSPYTYSYTGTLPSGLSLSSSGVISGTPTGTGTSSFNVTVTDANGYTGTQSFSITVNTSGGNYGFAG